MSELQQYYDDFRSGYWADPDPEICDCRGSGYALSEVDTWHECPIHYNGQIHPESYPDSEEEWEDNRQALIEAGVMMEDGTPACGYCGEFGHVHGDCPSPVCEECRNGEIMPSSECRSCQMIVQQQINNEDLPPGEPPGWDDPRIPDSPGEIPF